MGTLNLKYTSRNRYGVTYDCLPTHEFEKFNPSILDLGRVSKDGKYIESLAAIFDLEAFTSFCNQIDPHLVIPEFMDEFLSWLFNKISSEFAHTKKPKQTILWCQLPFYAKFLGDGVLFLWDTKNLSPTVIGNIVVSLLNTCRDYEESFLPKIKRSFVRPPTTLRCGIARGQIVSIGDNRDFVGPCINIAARLQKLGQFSFAFSKRGFNLDDYFGEHSHHEFILIKSMIRGVGDEELIYVLRDEYNLLPHKERKMLLP
jgi:hypothetical protein